MTRRRTFSLRPNQGGFSLIEVLVAVVILGFGLLGFALLQTMNVRFVQSSNYRTQATNLSYELLDQMRVNRVDASSYVGTYKATVAVADCQSPTGADISKDAMLKDWRCRLGKALGENATASVTQAGDVLTVNVSWGDERWRAGAGDTTFSASTRL